MPYQQKASQALPSFRDEKGVVQPLDVKAGDRILFGKWSGAEVKIDGEELLIMKESDILGVLKALPQAKRKPPNGSRRRNWSKNHGCKGSEILPRRP